VVEIVNLLLDGLRASSNGLTAATSQCHIEA
jgi:hypothetical protein